ncbi:nitroreductase family protein [Natrinema salaciae]
MTESELSTLLAHTFAPVADVREYIAKNLDDDPTLHLLSAQYPFDVFVIVGRHETLEPGVYRYAMREHALTIVEPLADPVEVDGLLDEISHQPYSRNSAITVLFTQNIDRERWAYRHDNSLRNLYVKIAGHAQRLILAGVSMEFGAFQTPALDDPVVDALVDVDGFTNPASYLVTLGK